MSFREWLPITRRNRVALAFAFLGLLCAVGWNFLPWYIGRATSMGMEWVPHGRAGAVIWPEVFSPLNYRVAGFGELGLFDFLIPIAFVSIALHALSALLAFFLWEMIHQTGHLKTWLGIANAVGGAAMVLLLFIGAFDHVSLVTAVLTLGMFSTALALFTYDHEMIMRRQRALR